MSPQPRFDTAFQSHLRELLVWRRDVRRFRRIPLAPGAVERLVDLARLAPSVGLSEPWRFVVVDDPGRRVAIRRNFELCNADAFAAQSGDRAAHYARLKLAGLDDAPVHLAVFVEPDPAQGHGLGRRTMAETIEYSAVAAIHTLWLAARAEGIGMGWISIVDPIRVAEIIEVPPDWKLIGYLCLGIPESEDDTPELERAGWERRLGKAPLIRR